MATVNPTDTDLYAALGVDATATGDDIARAFRARAKQLHPDTSPDPTDAQEFGELVAAYEVLSNHRTRRAYDDERAYGAGARRPAGAPLRAAGPARWTARRAGTAVVAGVLVTLLGLGAAWLTWHLHARDAHRRAEFRPVTAVRRADGDITFRTADGRVVVTREPHQHGEGSDPGATVAVRYDPARPEHVVLDAGTLGRDITLAIVSLKLLVGGPVFVVLGARRRRGAAGRVRPATGATAAR